MVQAARRGGRIPAEVLEGPWRRRLTLRYRVLWIAALSGQQHISRRVHVRCCLRLHRCPELRWLGSACNQKEGPQRGGIGWRPQCCWCDLRTRHCWGQSSALTAASASSQPTSPLPCVVLTLLHCPQACMECAPSPGSSWRPIAAAFGHSSHNGSAGAGRSCLVAGRGGHSTAAQRVSGRCCRGGRGSAVADGCKGRRRRSDGSGCCRSTAGQAAT